MYLLFFKNCSSNCYFYSNLIDLYKDWAFKYNRLFGKDNIRKKLVIVKIPCDKISTKFLCENFELCDDFFRKEEKKCLK